MHFPSLNATYCQQKLKRSARAKFEEQHGLFINKCCHGNEQCFATFLANEPVEPCVRSANSWLHVKSSEL